MITGYIDDFLLQLPAHLHDSLRSLGARLFVLGAIIFVCGAYIQRRNPETSLSGFGESNRVGALFRDCLLLLFRRWWIPAVPVMAGLCYFLEPILSRLVFTRALGDYLSDLDSTCQMFRSFMPMAATNRPGIAALGISAIGISLNNPLEAWHIRPTVLAGFVAVPALTIKILRAAGDEEDLAGFRKPVLALLFTGLVLLPLSSVHFMFLPILAGSGKPDVHFLVPLIPVEFLVMLAEVVLYSFWFAALYHAAPGPDGEDVLGRSGGGFIETAGKVWPAILLIVGLRAVLFSVIPAAININALDSGPSPTMFSQDHINALLKIRDLPFIWALFPLPFLAAKNGGILDPLARLPRAWLSHFRKLLSAGFLMAAAGIPGGLAYRIYFTRFGADARWTGFCGEWSLGALGAAVIGALADLPVLAALLATASLFKRGAFDPPEEDDEAPADEPLDEEQPVEEDAE